MAQDPRRCRGRGWRLCSWGACPAQRGQEARTPGIVSRSGSPAPAREEVLPGALGWCLPRYIVEQETRQRGSWEVEEGEPNAEPTRALPGQVEARLASGHPEVPKPGQIGGGGCCPGGGVPQVRVVTREHRAPAPLRTAQGLELRGPGRMPRGTVPPPPEDGGRRAALRPGRGGAQVQGPSADRGVGAAVTRVAGAVEAGHLLATGPSSRSRDPPLSPYPAFLPFSSLLRGWGRSRGPGPIPTHPNTLHSGGRPWWEPLSEFFQARLSRAGKGSGKGGGEPGASSACSPAGKGSLLVIQSASGLARIGNAPGNTRS